MKGKIETMKLSPAQRLMVEDGAPRAVFISPEARAAAWKGRALTSIPLFQVAPKDESDETKAFRAQEEERRRLKSLRQIDRMKTRMASKAIDYSKVRWDSRRAKFVPLTGQIPVAPGPESFRPSDLHGKAKRQVDAALVATEDWSRVNKDIARALAELNGVWDDKYAKLSGGLLVMTVTNRLKGLVKKGGEVKWH